jgi:hypothetical protein
MFGWRFIFRVKDRQQASSSLLFASPLAKPNLANLDQELLQVLSRLKSIYVFKQKFSSGLE